MTKKGCGFEGKVLAELKSGQLSDILKDHVAQCPYCQESIKVFTWMNQYRELSTNTQFRYKSLPDADQLYDKAFKVTPIFKKELEKKALRPLLIPKIMTIFVVVFISFYLLITQLPSIAQVLNLGSASELLGSSLASLLKIIAKVFSKLLLPIFLGIGSTLIILILSSIKPKSSSV